MDKQEFIRVWNQKKSPRLVAQALGVTERAVYQTRARLFKEGIVLQTEDPRKNSNNPYGAARVKWERSRSIEIKDGHVVIFSDPHWYPNQDPIGLASLRAVIQELKPLAVLCGGDALDGTQIGRHGPTRGWHEPPSLKEQLDVMVESMHLIKDASKGALTFMTLGNHDARFSRYLAEHAPAVEDLPGTRLEDYIPAWPLSWTVEINNNTVLRHRPLKSGANAPFQSTLHAGWHSFNGHLHNAQVRIIPRFKGFQFGADVGSLANPLSDAFDYAEAGIPWVQSFAVLTFRDHELLMPELCVRHGDRMYFRGSQV